MSDERIKTLHLPDLSIAGFRGVGSLSIERLGRVTLITGRNGVGKTTVLDAVRVYAARGLPTVLDELLERREEFMVARDEDNDPVVSPAYIGLFHGWDETQKKPIIIGPQNGKADLRIEVSTLEECSSRQQDLFQRHSMDVDDRVLKIGFQNKERVLPWGPSLDSKRMVARRYQRRYQLRQFLDNEWPVVECVSAGPGLPSNNTLASFWDKVALTEEEEFTIQALRLIDDRIERITVVGGDEPGSRWLGRRAVVKLFDHTTPVSLKSLGDGVTRMFSAGLALANSRNGFLVVDEAENGIHYSVQRDFWRMVLHTAHQNNVQVLATTHSWDCVKGFARAAVESSDTEGVLIRLERDDAELRAVEYTEEDLETAANQSIEVR